MLGKRHACILQVRLYEHTTRIEHSFDGRQCTSAEPFVCDVVRYANVQRMSDAAVLHVRCSSTGKALTSFMMEPALGQAMY